MTAAEPSTIGQVLKHHRIAAGLTQEALAARAGMSARSISDIERGLRQTPYRETIGRLAQALQLAPAEREGLLAAAQRRPGPPQVPPRSGPPGLLVAAATNLPPLVGRQRELAHLEHFLSGEGPPVLGLSGEPGIGKSRLLHEAATLATAMGWTMIAGTCQRGGLEDPFAPLAGPLTRHLVAQSPARQRALLRGCECLVPLMPELAETGSVLFPLEDPTPERARWLLFNAVGRLVANLAGPAGTLLLLDDVQWASADVIALLAVLLQAAEARQLRVVLAYRDSEVLPGDPLAEVLADLARDGHVARIPLGPLAPREAEELLRHVLEQEEATPLPATRIEQLVRRTDGVPFYLVSCAQSLRAGDAGGAGESDIMAEAGPTQPDVPWTVAQTIRQRVAALPMAARAVLNAAAVVGRAVPGTLLAQIVEQAEDAIVDGLETVCQARLLTEVAAHTDTYQFTHDLIHEVVIGDLSTRRRKLLHQRVAEALVRTSAGHPTERSAEVAYHFFHSDQPQRALGYFVEAAEQAHRTGAHRAQIALLSQAIPLVDDAQDRGQIAELLARRGRAWDILAQWREAVQDYRMALTGLDGMEHRARRAEVLIWLAKVCHWLLDVPATRRSATEGLRLAQALGREDLVALALSALGLADSSDGNLTGSLRRFDEAFALAQPHGLEPLSTGVEQSGLICYWLGRFDQAIQSSRQALDLAQPAYDTTTTARALGNLGLALTGQGRYTEAIATFDQARHFAQEQGTRHWLARTTSMYSSLYLAVYDYARAEALSEEAREISAELGWPPTRVSSGIDLLFNYARRQEIGRTERLLGEVATAVIDAQGAHGWYWRLRLAAVRGEIALAREAYEDAIRAAEDAEHQAHACGRVKYAALALETRAQALTRLGRKHEALQAAQRAVTLVRPTGDPALLLRATTVHLAIEGDEALFAEARAARQRIALALPEGEIRRHFLTTPPTPVGSLGAASGMRDP